MVRKRRTSPSKDFRQAVVAYLSRWVLEAELRRRGLRVLLVAGLTSALLIGVAAGFQRLESHVHQLPKYEHPLTLEWTGVPDWLRLPDNRHILESVTRQVCLQEADRLLDPTLAERIGSSLAQSHIGWVKSVDRVTVRPDAVVSIKCSYRRPAVWVHYGAFCYLVDDEAVRLPGKYELADCRGSRLLIVNGVKTSPPEVGEVWRGADLTAGLHLAGLLEERPFRHQIASIVVDNHGGRVDRNRPHLELATDRAASRILWGRPPDEEFGTEISASQKITLLETLYRQWGRIDMNRAYVNVMTWPDRITMPAARPAVPPRRLLRG